MAGSAGRRIGKFGHVSSAPAQLVILGTTGVALGPGPTFSAFSGKGKSSAATAVAKAHSSRDLLERFQYPASLAARAT